MAKPLHLFIKPPYTGWTLVHGYGPEVPPPAAGPVFHHETMLKTTNAVPVGGELFAACAGWLSACPPQVPGQEAAEEIEIPSGQQDLPAAVTLYLHLAWNVGMMDNFRQRTENIQHIHGFVYRNIDVNSLETKLGALLDEAAFPPGSATRAQTVEMLVRGNVLVPVTAGHVIGNAATQDAAPGTRRVGFAVIADQGLFDASYAYDWMRDYVENGQPDIDAYLNLAPKRWPIIDSARTDAQVITDTVTSIFSMTVFEELRRRRPTLTSTDWRKIGKNQKNLYRTRLQKRLGHAPNSTEPPFEFDDLDWKNIFQLEAVIEFYANFTDPWLPGAVPRADNDPAYVTVDLLDPRGTAATPGNNSNQLILDDPFAAEPSLAAYQQIRLSRIRTNHDTIYLDADTNAARPSRVYQITAVSVATRTVTLDAEPQLTGGTSAWRITLQPVLILIDSFGGRLNGSAATVPNASQPIVSLDNLPGNSKINPYLDTIYLPSDTARPSRTYRICDVSEANDTVTLDGTPILTGGTGSSSKWQIPAGLSGNLPATSYYLGPSIALGWDHYDGVMVTIQSDRVLNSIRWTSYSSHNYTPPTDSNLSSIKGNAQYRFASYYSQRELGDPEGNAATPVPNHPDRLHLDGTANLGDIRVNDRIYLDADVGRQTKVYKITHCVPATRTVTLDGTPSLSNATSQWHVNAGGPPFRNYCFSVKDVTAAGDSVAAARFYFPEIVVPDQDGKTGIRIHDASQGSVNSQARGSGSAGCLVSFNFYALRDALIELYQNEYARLHETPVNRHPEDSEVRKAYHLTRAQSMDLWYVTESATGQPQNQLTSAGWTNKIVGTLWLIRPDERPL